MFFVKKKNTGSHRAWVPGFPRVFCQLLFFICDLQEREHGAKWQIPFKKVGKIHQWYVCYLEYRFSRILVFHPTREEPTSGLKMDIQASLLQTFIQISWRHFVKNQVTCLRPYAILHATERTVIFSPAPLRAKRNSCHSHLLWPSSRTKGVGEWFLNVISSKLVNTPKLHLP